jgi:hypothetical protein
VGTARGRLPVGSRASRWAGPSSAEPRVSGRRDLPVGAQLTSLWADRLCPRRRSAGLPVDQVRESPPFRRWPRRAAGWCLRWASTECKLQLTVSLAAAGLVEGLNLHLTTAVACGDLTCSELRMSRRAGGTRRRQPSWCTHPDAVSAPLFSEPGFFLAADKVQVKYEMLCAHCCQRPDPCLRRWPVKSLHPSGFIVWFVHLLGFGPGACGTTLLRWPRRRRGAGAGRAG